MYGLSRGTQAMLSVAQPVVAALVAPGDPAPARIVVLVVAALTGFAAVLALNDLVDAHLDRQRRDHTGPQGVRDIENAGGRHPVAQGQLPWGAALAWVTGLLSVTLVATALLGWVCVVLFLAAVALEVGYCRLARTTCAKTVLSGIMIAVGATVGWFAVTSEVDPLRLGLLVLWMVAWEIGGRNIPNDLADVDEDTRMGIRTVPVVRGVHTSAVLVFVALVVASAASIALVLAARPGVVGLAGSVAAAVYALLLPGVRLLRAPGPSTALSAFNRASFHPVLVLIVVLA
ncbi:hypothetical protein FNH07_21590 [Amycolatopsis bartoniae]|nr:hypothetical protein FNH07_21590 [Amycolatopsis bartoniae]